MSILSFSLDSLAAGAKVEQANHDSSESGELGAKVRDGETMKVRVMEGETERMKVTEGELERVKVKEMEVMKVKDGEVERSSGHRVTFNDQNEVASQDRDGTFKVRQLQLLFNSLPEANFFRDSNFRILETIF